MKMLFGCLTKMEFNNLRQSDGAIVREVVTSAAKSIKKAGLKDSATLPVLSRETTMMNYHTAKIVEKHFGRYKGARNGRLFEMSYGCTYASWIACEDERGKYVAKLFSNQD